MEGHSKFPGGGGVLKAKFLEAMYENKPEFAGGGGGGVQNKKPSVRGVWIFSGTAHSDLVGYKSSHEVHFHMSILNVSAQGVVFGQV